MNKVLIFFRVNDIYFWSLNISFNIYVKMKKVEYFRREYLLNIIVIWNVINYVFVVLLRGCYEYRNGDMNVYSIFGEW